MDEVIIVREPRQPARVAGRVMVDIGKWIVLCTVWVLQYGACVPAYAAWRLFVVTPGWVLFVLLTGGFGLIIWWIVRRGQQRDDRVVKAVRGQRGGGHPANWTAVTTPWLKGWI